jgi:DNA-binding CsgD family transcriptional regulator
MSGAISSQALSELIGSIYDCALDPGHWDRTLRELAEAFSEEPTGLAPIDRGLLLPHLRRAVTISEVLDARAIEKARMAETLDALKCGVVLTNRGGAITHANRVAERIFRHGGPVQTVRGMLTANLPAAAKKLHDAIRLAASDESTVGKAGLAIRLNEDGEKPLFAHVLPLRGGGLCSRMEPQAAAVFIGPGQDEAEAAEAMTVSFGLTRAESRLLESLLAGHTLAESARVSGVAFVTAKTHLKNIFQKMGVNRQAELMRLAAHAASPARSR